jgi:hypothetical protein
MQQVGAAPQIGEGELDEQVFIGQAGGLGRANHRVIDRAARERLVERWSDWK